MPPGAMDNTDQFKRRMVAALTGVHLDAQTGKSDELAEANHMVALPNESTQGAQQTRRYLHSAPPYPHDEVQAHFRSVAQLSGLSVSAEDGFEGAASALDLQSQPRAVEDDAGCWPSTPEGVLLPRMLLPDEDGTMHWQTQPLQGTGYDLPPAWPPTRPTEAHSPERLDAQNQPGSPGLSSPGLPSQPVLSTRPVQLNLLPTPVQACRPATTAPPLTMTTEVERTPAATHNAAGYEQPLQEVDLNDTRQKTSIAELQELLQSAQYTSRFKFPAGVKVLQWSYRQRAEGRLYFRAVLAFFNNGVAHHVAGSWQSCKKHARQSAADAALQLVRETAVTGMDCHPVDVCVDLASMLPAPRSRHDASHDYIQQCEELFSTARDTDTAAGPEWFTLPAETGDGWQALLRVQVLGVIHTFAGPSLSTSDDACTELAHRVLWYMGMRRCRICYIPNRAALLASRCEVRPPPLAWSNCLGAISED
eukprot:CAMPEP_0178389684 /NCGR_PEP_ID=MMETSP0689_2-20121128/10251_1 /TAXON_ID=160604 /ORGANISM="Amphidinium massartii, Strain CS-259" /LENGTH=476 /DNA_ID=CAMNT_0020010157 /DNA_START=92 /DNA_END=1522 /DNA_ORIENTATION=-